MSKLELRDMQVSPTQQRMGLEMEATAGVKAEMGDRPELVGEAAGVEHGRRGESRWESIMCEVRGACKESAHEAACHVRESTWLWCPGPAPAASKSITLSTNFRLVYLECMGLACQTSALSAKHAMVTIAPPASAAPGLVIITSVKNEKECRRKAVQNQRQDDWAGSPTPGPRQLHLLLPLLGAGEWMQFWPSLAPSVDPAPFIIHPVLRSTLEKAPCLCQNNICAPASLCVVDKPANSSPGPGALWVKTPH